MLKLIKGTYKIEMKGVRAIWLVLMVIWSISTTDALWPFSKKKNLSPVIFALLIEQAHSSTMKIPQYDYQSTMHYHEIHIAVPGDGGSQMEAKLHKSTNPLIICSKNSDWFSLWLNLELLVIPVIYCWVDNIKLYYDNITRTTHNTPGVEIRIPGWGDPEVVEWIDPTRNKAGAYFKDIANLLVSMGYERKKNIRGAPYDFRKGPSEQKQFFTRLKELVEVTYEMNNDTPITFITHSMGSPMTLAFLHQQSAEWKSKYVKRQISLAGAWAGSMKAVKVFAMGDDLDALLLNTHILKEEQISNPSTAWLLPSPLFWKPSDVLVETPSRVYTMAQLESFFNDIDYRNGWEMRKDNLYYTMNFSPPDVELHCLYGDGLDTVERLHYNKDNMISETPKLVMGPGDGTVNRRSLRACQAWLGYQSHNITTMALSGVNHMDILSHKDVMNYIKSVLTV